ATSGQGRCAGCPSAADRGPIASPDVAHWRLRRRAHGWTLWTGLFPRTRRCDMATVQAILDRKGGQVVTIDVADSVLAAATLMNERSIGGLVVLDGGEVAGMFTERDILRRVVAAKRDPARTTVGEVMTTQVAFCRRDTLLDDCRAVM